MAAAGQDIVSMRRCLRQLGVNITDLDEAGRRLDVKTNLDDQPPRGTVSWEVKGTGPHGMTAPVSVLHAGNSGTALRILMAMCARFDVPVMVDGDASLRARNHDVMVGALESLGVSASRGLGWKASLAASGPMATQRVALAGHFHIKSTHHRLLLAAPALPKPPSSSPPARVFPFDTVR